MEDKSNLTFDSSFNFYFNDTLFLVEKNSVSGFRKNKTEFQETKFEIKHRPADPLPSFYLYLVIICIALFARLNVVFNKYITGTIKSGFDYKYAMKMAAEPGTVRKKVQLWLMFLYFLSTGMYLFILSIHFKWSWPTQIHWIRFIVLFSIPVVLMALRYFLMHILGLLFNKEKLINNYLFHHFIINQITGIVIIPFIILIPFASGFIAESAIYMSFFLIFMLIILKIFRAFQFVIKKLILKFYLILYLCALELLPLLLAVKYILSLA